MKIRSRIWGVLGLGLCLIAVGCGDEEKNAKTTPGGVKYIDQTEGIGEPAKAGDFVEVHSIGTLRDGGSQFDNSSIGRHQPYRRSSLAADR